MHGHMALLNCFKKIDESEVSPIVADEARWHWAAAFVLTQCIYALPGYS